MKIAITGANSSVGMNLLAQVDQQPDLQFPPAVFATTMLQSLPKLWQAPTVSSTLPVS